MTKKFFAARARKIAVARARNARTGLTVRDLRIIAKLNRAWARTVAA
jgi:hypothetical protein